MALCDKPLMVLNNNNTWRNCKSIYLKKINSLKFHGDANIVN